MEQRGGEGKGDRDDKPSVGYAGRGKPEEGGMQEEGQEALGAY